MELPSKVVCDTNVLISALTHPGTCRRLIYSLLAADVEIVLSDYILSEAEEVLKRNKFENKEIIFEILEKIKNQTTIVKVKFEPTEAPLRDSKDHPIIQTALQARAEVIVTGDNDLLSLKKFKEVRILSVRDLQKPL